MSELFLRTLLIGLATSIGSYFIIKFLHKHLRQATIILGMSVFLGLFGYGIYQEHKAQSELDDAISKISKELDSITKDNALHDLIKRNIAQKDGVSLDIVPALDTAILKINKIYQTVLQDPDYKVVITSANDFNGHKKNSAHYKGEAVDVRIKNIDKDMKNDIIKLTKGILGPNFTVIHEDIGTPNEHLHVQLKQRG